MAQIKSNPTTKFKSSSRTSSSKKKNLKLKWWYALPVIAIVAVTGYAIVHYSKAATNMYVRNVDNGGFRGGDGPNVNGKGGPTLRTVGYGAVMANWTSNEMKAASHWVWPIAPDMGFGKLCVQVVGNDAGVAGGGWAWELFVQTEDVFPIHKQFRQTYKVLNPTTTDIKCITALGSWIDPTTTGIRVEIRRKWGNVYAESAWMFYN